eukprot:TRINITY_DN113664_c0_g1_i1.p1 TRINITY_DN113664_c0_g1~~TRINITY_DN113664_c0_g1_i1.p1  ORF type:complete len:460 (-),score=113.17 TRINITY_DN113664_c0_g1_i1:206-1585(-)
MAPATALKDDASSTQRTLCEREILKVEKKLREIEKLKQRKDEGEELDSLQVEKINKGEDLKGQLAELQEQKEKEAAEAERKAEEEEAAQRAKEEEEARPQRKQFDASCLAGAWLDNLGQLMMVTRGLTRRGAGRRLITYTYKVSVVKEGVETARLVIRFDETEKEWRCGNGLLVREETEPNRIVWTTADGRLSEWTPVPNGPVYFDGPQGSAEAWDGPTYFDPADPASESHENDEAWEAAWESGDYGSGWYDSAGYGDGNGWWTENWNAAGQGYNSGASRKPSEYVCVPVDDVGPPSKASKKKEKAAAQPPGLEEVVAEVQESLTSVRLSAETDGKDVQLKGDKLDWGVPLSWGELRKMPADALVKSPLFDVATSLGMQLEFYPSGCKSGTPGGCTLQLVRGQGSTGGIKFELILNGRSSGPKACLGRRFLADFPMPFDASEDSDWKHVCITFHVLHVF